jgi:hypothetical protein
MANVSIDSGSDPRGLAPGVYIQERGPTPGAGMATGVPLFIGFVQPQIGGVADDEEDDGDGPKAVRLASWDQFAHTVGHPRADSFLGYAVRGFFENGGRRCVVLPLSVHGGDGYRRGGSVPRVETCLSAGDVSLR